MNWRALLPRTRFWRKLIMKRLFALSCHKDGRFYAVKKQPLFFEAKCIAKKARDTINKGRKEGKARVRVVYGPDHWRGKAA
jgi:hypothetical protein